MIPRYTDLAANERTYLAWMRTALALIAFGFLLARFDLLVHYFTNTMTQGNAPAISPLGRDAGIILSILGIIIMVLSTMRFTVTTRRINSENKEFYSFKSVMLTGGIFILLAVFVLIYVAKLLF